MSARIATVFLWRIYLVGIDDEEALQLVVCNLWRKKGTESTQQDSGSAARHKKK